MFILALYYPKPEDFYNGIAALILTFLVLCLLAFWPKCSVRVVAMLMAVGGVVGLAHEIRAAFQVRPGGYDMSRRISGTNYSDSFFEFATSLHVGYGCLKSLAGMLTGLLLYGIGVAVCRRLNWQAVIRSKKGQANS